MISRLVRLRVDFYTLDIRLGKLIITLGTQKSRHNLLEGYDAINKSLHNSETLVKYTNTGFGLGTCQGRPPSPKGLCVTFRLLQRGCPKAPHISNSHILQMKRSKLPWRAGQNIYLKKYNFSYKLFNWASRLILQPLLKGLPCFYRPYLKIRN